MAALQAARMTPRSQLTSLPHQFVLPFLAPSIQRARPAPAFFIAHFSTSPALCKGGDNNKNRGVSAQRHTGLRRRQRLGIFKYKRIAPPKPRLEREPPKGDSDHGLWAFFKDKKRLQTPEEEHRHGKGWSIQDLRKKSWDDLHLLWWVCVKERNRLATEKLERARIEGLYGDAENEDRDVQVQETMKAIQETLLERFDAWDDAYTLARSDPEMDLSGNGPTYNPYNEPYETAELEDAAEVADEAKEQEVKSLPKPDFFSDTKNPPSSTMEKVALKTRKLLWNQ